MVSQHNIEAHILENQPVVTTVAPNQETTLLKMPEKNIPQKK